MPDYTDFVHASLRAGWLKCDGLIEKMSLLQLTMKIGGREVCYG